MVSSCDNYGTTVWSDAHRDGALGATEISQVRGRGGFLTEIPGLDRTVVAGRQQFGRTRHECHRPHLVGVGDEHARRLGEVGHFPDEHGAVVRTSDEPPPIRVHGK